MEGPARDKQSKILITGASGFIGSHLVEEALGRKGLEVYAGLRPTSKRTYLKDERIRFVELEWSDPGRLKAQLSHYRFDYIIHNAGTTAAPSRELFFNVNTGMVQTFADALMATGVLPQKFTFISSVAAFGPADDSNAEYLCSDMVPRPITAYGESKLAAEKHLVQLSGFPYLIFRPTAVYGPRERDIFTFFQLLNRGLEFYIGRQQQQLSFIYVKDLTRAVMDATLSGVKHKAYFVSDGQAYAADDLGRYSKMVLNRKTLKLKVPVLLVRGVAQVLEGIGKLSGKTPALNLEKVRELASTNWRCDIKPLKEDFGWQAQYDLEKGLAETLQWYRQEKWL